MKLMILGAGPLQVNAIKKAQSMGISVVASDYKHDSVGKKFADFCALADTFDAKATIDAARKHNVDGIMTTGTDQPILTASTAASALGLPCVISPDTALLVTNKKHMKIRFKDFNIPTAEFRIIGREFAEEELEGLRPPLVVKPLDSQGQRGIFKLSSASDVRSFFDDVAKHSRTDEIIVEEYYESSEITVSGWAEGGRAHVLTITDRVCFEDDKRIGICTSHEFPSRHMESFSDDIISITQRIVECFNIEDGPLYFQMLIGSDGVKVNEIACRIGGAYEDLAIPLLTGVDILSLQISLALGMPADYSALYRYDIKNCRQSMSIQLFFANPGKIEHITPVEEILAIDGVCFAGYNFSEGDSIPSIENATQRAGFVGIGACGEPLLLERIERVYEKMQFKDPGGANLVIRGQKRNERKV